MSLSDVQHAVGLMGRAMHLVRGVPSYMNEITPGTSPQVVGPVINAAAVLACAAASILLKECEERALRAIREREEPSP